MESLREGIKQISFKRDAFLPVGQNEGEAGAGGCFIPSLKLSMGNETSYKRLQNRRERMVSVQNETSEL